MKNGSILKILLCDPDVRILSRIEAWILAMGEKVTSTTDGIEALEIFKIEKPDIVLISENLKNMGGIELIKEVKKIVPTQAVILMLRDEDTIFKTAIDLQVDKYLNKPVEAKQLFYSIDSLAQEKLWHKEFKTQKKVLQDYKDAIDLSFSVSRHDRDGNVIYVNDLFCSSTGLSHEDAMNGLLNPLHNENEDMEVVWEALNTGFIYRDRQIFILDDGKRRVVDVTAVALINGNDEVYEYLVFTDDVTKIIEAAKQAKNVELDKRLAKINHAKELSRVKDSFLTIFTHELKTPLNSIINFSGYVAKHLDKEEFRKKEALLSYVKEINKSGLFMLSMITNLMEAMKLKDSKIKLHIHELNISNSMLGILSSKEYQLDGILIEKNFEEQLTIMSDEFRVVQILEQLISNAIKYAKQKISITISSNQEEFLIEISDDGDGFADKAGLFNLFEQADADSLTREGQGVGTGLFIVKQLCERMKYNIELLNSTELGGARVLLKGKKDIS